jgi:hypothetical protein
MKKYRIKLDITLFAESQEEALNLATPFAQVTEIDPASEGGGNSRNHEGYYTDNFNSYYIDSQGIKYLRL